MRRSLVVLMAVVMVVAVVAAAPAEAIDRAQVQAMKEEARAAFQAQRAEAEEATKKKPGPKTVLVRCDKGESVQKALDKNPGEVVIEIQGICAENVRIERRSDVTLRGKSGDPARDGLQGVADPPRNAALEIRYSDRIRVEQLSFSNGVAGGLYLAYARVTALNLHTNDNAWTGFHASFDSQVLADWLTSNGNGICGLEMKDGGSMRCRSCNFVDNNQWGAQVSSGTSVTLWSTIVEGNNGLSSNSGGYVDVDCGAWTPTDHECRISVSNVALSANSNGQVGYGPGVLRGRVHADSGQVWLFGAQQEELPESDVNSLTGEAFLELVGNWEDNQGTIWTSSVAATELRQFTHAVFSQGSEFPYPITCFDAADAIVDGGVDPAGMVIDCPHVPEP